MDTVDITDQMNDLLEAYSLGEGGITVVDLDAWATADLNLLATLAEQMLEQRGEQRAERDDYSTLQGEYDASGLSGIE